MAEEMSVSLQNIASPKVSTVISSTGMGLRVPSKTNKVAIRVPENRAMTGTRMELDRSVATLVEKYKPEKIILFGSLVTGRIHEWSDIDLLVSYEKEESGKPGN